MTHSLTRQTTDRTRTGRERRESSHADFALLRTRVEEDRYCGCDRYQPTIIGQVSYTSGVKKKLPSVWMEDGLAF